jgi:hypothetical protein
MNSIVPNILTTAQSSTNLIITTPTTINLANISIIDNKINLSDQQLKQTDETTTDDDDEHIQLKRLKLTTEQIEAPVEDEEDEEEEQPDEVKFFFFVKE